MKTDTHKMSTSFLSHLARLVADEQISERTAAAYTSDASLFALWFEQTNGYVLLSTRFTPTDVKEYKAFLLARGSKPATVNRKLAALKALAKFYGVTLEVKGVEQQELGPRWLDRLQQSALLREAEKAINAANTEPRQQRAAYTHAIIIILLNTGLRVSELCALDTDDVVVNERSGAFTVRQGKGGKRRTVPLNDEARKAAGSLLWPLHLRRWQIWHDIAELGRRAKLAVSPHTLRHTFAHNLSGKVQLDRVATLLGHANLNTTRKYTAPGERDLQAAVDTL